jgi:hypothetical protein
MTRPLWCNTINTAFKKPKDSSLLKTTFKALRNVSLCPRKIGKIVAPALRTRSNRLITQRHTPLRGKGQW